MTPGLAGPPFPAGANLGSVVAIASLEAPSVPVAVGVCEVDVSALRRARGEKGRAVRVVHWAGDEVWGWSTSGRRGVEAPGSVEGWAGLVEGVEGLGVDDEDDDAGDGGGVQLEERNVPPADTPPRAARRDLVDGEDAIAEVVDASSAGEGEMAQPGKDI